MSDLKQQAKELGVKGYANMNDDTLQAAIDAALAEPPAIEGITSGPTPSLIPATIEPDSSEKTISIILDADYWPEEGDRKQAGTAIDVPSTKAKELLRNGKAHLPMPGDE